jgi:hypothetical protein
VYMAVPGALSKNDVLLDCGATSHMFCDQRHFENYSLLSQDETVSMGNECPLVVAS